MAICCSICIPCYKRLEQVRNTLLSIYEDNSEVSLKDYEVVLSDNDPECELKCIATEFAHLPNFRYISTECEGFMNSFYALSYGQGDLLKLHNSQNKIRKGMLAEMVTFAKENEGNKPLLYHSNGFLGRHKILSFSDFNSFMEQLSYWSSWSGGMTIWKEDFDQIGAISIDPLFPHTSVFITQSFKKEYVIDDRPIYQVQRVPKRGGHNKFAAFTVHYPSLIQKCYENGSISKRCKELIFDDLIRYFIPSLLFNKYVARIETFEADGFRKNCQKYLPKGAYWIAWLNVPMVPIRQLVRIIRNILHT